MPASRSGPTSSMRWMRTSHVRSDIWRCSTPTHAAPVVPADRGTRAREEANMSGRIAGRVASITGAARGQGRAHAIALAREGADVVCVDVPNNLETLPYSPGTAEDLKETVAAVEALDRRAIAVHGDVRRQEDLDAAVERAISELGRLDIVVANEVTPVSRTPCCAQPAVRLSCCEPCLVTCSLRTSRRLVLGASGWLRRRRVAVPGAAAGHRRGRGAGSWSASSRRGR